MARLNIVHENPNQAARAFEVREYNVPNCLASIQDKKIEGVALNCLEIFVDWIASTFYDAYNTLYDLKRVMYRHGCGIRGGTEAYSIHHFHDGTRLYDLTDTQRIRIWRIDDHGVERDAIMVTGPNHEPPAHRVLFSRQAPGHVIDFSAERGTRSVVVTKEEEQDPDDGDICTIYEYEEDLPAQAAREWSFNIAAEPVEVAHPLSHYREARERVYFAEAPRIARPEEPRAAASRKQGS